MKIGILGARKYKDRQYVIALVNCIPADSQIVTSGCKGVCSWVREGVEKRGMDVILFEPDLSNIRAWFEVPKRYYRRNKEMVETCDILHAFISEDDGYTGGTRFEIEYAMRLGIPVHVHWENGISLWYYQYFLPFHEQKQSFFLSWQEFFSKTNLEVKGGIER